MANHVEREQTNQVTELTADELECVSGGFFAYKLEDVKVSSISVSGHSGSSPTQE
jgi:bacteriocin-like protein